MSTNKITLPMIPLRGLSVFPYMVLHFDVGREKSINALEEAMINDQLIFLSAQINAETDIPTPEDFYTIGTIAKIKQMLKLPGDAIRVLVEGISRGVIEKIIFEDPYFKCEVSEIYEDSSVVDEETEALMRAVLAGFEEYLALNGKISPDIYPSVASIEEPGRLADVITSHMDIRIDQKQEILEAFDIIKRLDILHKLLLRENEVLKIERDINIKVRSQINKVQKEYYLKEQLRVIQEELGQDENIEEEIENYTNKLKKLKLSKKIHEKVQKEINRLAKTPSSSAESAVIRNYVEWILDLPWNKHTKDNIDIKFAKEILDQDHYGLEKVKERVLEYLSVRKLSKSMKGPILCLVGPPGVGKTSIAKSISRSLNRNFVRMSLGGVRDEAEIRGHRRTYIGAIPGRIISAIKDAESNNPVFLFDEVDKIGNDFRGDPASALLEVLDPEQNKEFTDHYLEVPFDLSNVMFITTANTTETIPRPLLDRMEVIDVSGYTEEEKVNIALKYLVPKQKKEHGLDEKHLILSEQVVRDIINYYTRESGVRNLERQIANICRKAAKRIVEDNISSVKINSVNLHKYLGKKKYRYDVIEVGNEIGVTTGLAWTVVGGDTLSIETVIMEGTGKLVLTGQLGDVMQESAKAGISYIRAKANDLGINPHFYKEYDIHIHIPEGATPKDGPSAGVTMCTSVISALTGIPTDKKVAMTGEITLRGKVLPVGGIKEKVLAANRAGIKKVLLPSENEKDIEEIPDNVRKKLEFVLVENMDEVLKHALVRENE
ncbi:MAG: endopeptidase La [Clostridiales bacterium]|nr:endopeptidase La [Clostridiales bacterium]